MSVVYNPRIVTSGLVLNLDAANPKSYPGSGTTWADLSGLGNNASMFGSVPFQQDITSCWNFSTATAASGGVGSQSSTLGFTFSSNMIPRTGNFTLSVWMKNPNTTSGQVGLFSNAGGADGYRFGVGLNGIYFLIGPTYTEGTISFLNTLSADLWHNVVVVYNRSGASVLCYLNGVFQNSASIPADQTIMQNQAPGIVRSSCCGIYTGKLAGVSAYNVALSSSQISQNFNAMRGRFGV